MKDKIFIDSNIWLYAFLLDDEQKNKAAKDLINKKNIAIVTSIQIINEVCVNLIKKISYSEDRIEELINDFHQKYSVVDINKETLVEASKLRRSHSFSFWDSLIVASALQSKCKILYTEDMQHRQRVENKLKIINPFELEISDAL